MTLSRRQTIAWMAAAASMMSSGALAAHHKTAAHHKMPAPLPRPGAGYGTDPDMMHPKVTWKLTMTPAQRNTARAAADLILPADAHSPSAGSLHVDAFIDEWISAPYPDQQADHAPVLLVLVWLEAESERRFGKPFADAGEANQRAILDDIAWNGRVKVGLEKQAQAFGELRKLTIAGFYSRPEGTADIGYLGNAPMAGDYPGPSAEALTDLRSKLKALGLPDPT